MVEAGLSPRGDQGGKTLLAALARLDGLLARAVEIADALYGPAAGGDPFRGLHLSRADVDRLFEREPGVPALWSEAAAPGEIPEEGSPLGWLATLYGLEAFDLDVLLIALAPELDRRYERLYAYLQDDISRKRPTVDLVLELLCSTAAEKLERRSRFAPTAPLVRHGLVELVADPREPRPPLLSHFVKLDEQVLRFLIGERTVDARLTGFCEEVVPSARLDDLPLAAGLRTEFAELFETVQERDRPFRFYFRGRPGVGRRRVAEALAAELGQPLLVVDLERAAARAEDFEARLELVRRHELLFGAVVCLEGLDAVGDQLGRRLVDTLPAWTGVVVITGSRSWVPGGREPSGVIEVAFPLPDLAARRSVWRAELEASGVGIGDDDIEPLARRFRLTPAQIAEAIAMASSTVPAGDALFHAARAQNGHELSTLARKIEPLYIWDDLVLPDDAVEQLREICRRVEHRDRVLSEWGFERRLSLGKGVNALFAGPSGTGKTMAAEVVAGEIGQDFYRIDLSRVVSKYIGETEKNLDRVFRAAEDSNAILFFDEADALFGKRSEVRDSHDRYANLEISYLLQKMEQYEGVAILATNLRGHLDDAFLRRLAFTVHFPFPDEGSRRRIWEGIWPAATPVGEDVDFELLAGRFKLAGGNIKNIALASAFLAASDGGRIAMEHLVQATRREYQKTGKRLADNLLEA